MMQRIRRQTGLMFILLAGSVLAQQTKSKPGIVMNPTSAEHGLVVCVEPNAARIGAEVLAEEAMRLMRQSR